MRITLAAIGVMRGSWADLSEFYIKQIQRWPLRALQMNVRGDYAKSEKKQREWEMLQRAISEKTTDIPREKKNSKVAGKRRGSTEKSYRGPSFKGLTCYLDARGKILSSEEFAEFLREQEEKREDIAFVLGGASGFPKDALNFSLRTGHGKLLSLGTATWPHKLARVMLIEQIYRAQQILSGHPYHSAE